MESLASPLTNPRVEPRRGPTARLADMAGIVSLSAFGAKRAVGESGIVNYVIDASDTMGSRSPRSRLGKCSDKYLNLFNVNIEFGGQRGIRTCYLFLE